MMMGVGGKRMNLCIDQIVLYVPSSVKGTEPTK